MLETGSTKRTRNGCELCGAESREAVAGLEPGVVCCKNCGLVQRWPRPAATELERHYAETYYIDQERIGVERLNHARAPVFNKILGDWRRRGLGGKLLDVGAGYGGFVRLARDHGFDAIGIEISESACREAAQRLGVRVIPGALGDQLGDDGPFDFITLWNVLDQVASPIIELRRIHSLLKPGGMIAVRVPNVGFHVFVHRVFRWLRSPLAWLGVEDPSIFMTWSYSGATLRAMLELAGFTDVHVVNSSLTSGDPYRSLRLGDIGARAIKAVASGVATMVATVDRDCLIAPSLYCEAFRPDLNQRGALSIPAATASAITS